MFKIILKNLWRRRRNNGWLFAELIIITVLMWWIIDPVAVTNYDLMQSVGYDSDRLVAVTFNAYPPEASDYNPEADSADVKIASVNAIRNRLRAIPGVENVTYFSSTSGFLSAGMMTNPLRSGNQAVDSLARTFLATYYSPGYSYFETYGIEPVAGSPSLEEMSNADGDCVIITESIARFFWPGEEPGANIQRKRFIKEITEDGDTTWRRVAGVVRDVRTFDYMHMSSLIFRPDQTGPLPRNSFTLIVRVNDTTNPSKFADEIATTYRGELKAGNFFLNSADPYATIRSKQWQRDGASRYTMMMILATFFFLSLMLGTIGNLWLQTRQRFREAGVLRSFGAGPANIVKMLLGESAVLCAVAFIIGDLIYLQIALRFRLSSGLSNFGGFQWDDIWVEHFWPHFFIVSGVVLLIMEACVLLGTWIPAHSLSRINPIDALRDE